ncbi:hypothetical protein ACFSHP_02205 [Novosphingobium panipatense]
MRAVLGFVGIQDPVFVVAEGLAIDADTRTKAVAAAVEQAGALAIPA